MSRLLSLGILSLFLITGVSAHEEGEQRTLNNYTITLLSPDKLSARNDNILAIHIELPNNTPATDLNVQGQIMQDEHDIFYAHALETSPGEYEFIWHPLTSGAFYVQFVFRADGTMLKPTFPITVSLPWYLRIWHFFTSSTPPERKAIHWHSQLNISICGTPYHLPLEAGDLNKQHTHNSTSKLHLHAMVKDERSDELRLGNLFEQLSIPFNSTCLADYCNGDPCPDGKQGMLTMTVNNKPNQEFDNYLWRDGDVISVRFG